MLDDLSAQWLRAKETERLAVEERRKIEDKLLSLIGVPETLDGTETANTGAFKIKIVGRMNRKVDADKLHELAIENGLEAHLRDLFRWKPEINAKAWAAADDAITAPLLDAITTTPGRASFVITKE
tara:strand:+ start:138 stop:515 length:378 start_codon:yes stop_codon:yes gene_type:complete